MKSHKINNLSALALCVLISVVFPKDSYGQTTSLARVPYNVAKFKPGLWPQMNASLQSVSESLFWSDQLQPHIDKVCSLEHVAGCHFIVYWGSLEASDGDYSSGDAILDELYDRMAAIKKPFTIHIWPRKYQSASNTISGSSASVPFVPQYILDMPHGLVASVPARSANLSSPVINGKYIALYQHIGMRYDSRKWFHGVESEETSDVEAWESQGYSPSARATQWYRFLDEVKPFFRNSMVRISVNWWGWAWGQQALDEMKVFVETLYLKGYAIGGPDMYTHAAAGNAPSFGECILRGMGPGIGLLHYGFSANCGTKDYRGLMPIAYHNEMINNSSRSQLWNYHRNVIKNTHLVWQVMNVGDDGDGGAATTETAFHGENGFYAFYASKPEPRTAAKCPKNLEDRCSFE